MEGGLTFRPSHAGRTDAVPRKLISCGAPRQLPRYPHFARRLAKQPRFAHVRIAIAHLDNQRWLRNEIAKK